MTSREVRSRCSRRLQATPAVVVEVVAAWRDRPWLGCAIGGTTKGGGSNDPRLISGLCTGWYGVAWSGEEMQVLWSARDDGAGLDVLPRGLGSLEMISERRKRKRRAWPRWLRRRGRVLHGLWEMGDGHEDAKGSVGLLL